MSGIGPAIHLNRLAIDEGAAVGHQQPHRRGNLGRRVFEPLIATLKPSRARSSAQARPMLRPAPVISAARLRAAAIR
jgi:hypothetical protein